MAFLYFVSFSVFEMRYLMIIWKARRPSEPNQDWEDMRRQISSMYTKICTQFHLFSSITIFFSFFSTSDISLIVGFSILYFLADYLLHFLLFMHSYWIPQIYCNATRNTRNPLDRKYLFGISLIRLFIPLCKFPFPPHSQPFINVFN